MAPKVKHVVEDSANARPEPTFTVDLATIRSDFVANVEAAIECRAIVERVVLEVDEEIVLAHMDHMAVPWAIEGVITDLFEALHVAFVEREERSKDSSTLDDEFDAAMGIPEPSTVPSDSWSRGAIPKRKQLVFDAPKDMLNATTSSDRLKQTLRRGKDSSIRPVTPSMFGGPTPDDNSPAGKRPTTSSEISAGEHSSPSLRVSRTIVRQNSTAASPASPAAGGNVTSNTENVSQPMSARPVQSEEELRLLREAKEVAEKMKELKRTANRVDHALHDMKASTPFVVDKDSVLVVNPIDPAKLPPREEPKIAIDRNPDTVQGKKKGQPLTPGLAAPQAVPNRVTTPSTGLGGVRAKNSGLSAKQFYNEEAVTQPMISNVQPAAGVASREGEGLFLVVKKSELKIPKSKMTKGEFNKVLQAQRGVELPTAQPEEENSESTPAAAAAAASTTGKKLAPLDKAAPAATSTGVASPQQSAKAPQPVQGAHDPELTPQPTAARPTRGTTPASGGHRKLLEPQRHRVRPSSSASGVALPLERPPSRAKTPQVHVANELFDETARDFLESITSS